MTSRHEFPYLQSLIINDAYAVKNLTVPVFQPGEEFKHLILTGRNGSGKTTVLRSIIAIISGQVSKGSFSQATSIDGKVEIFFAKTGTTPYERFLNSTLASCEIERQDVNLGDELADY